METLLTHLIRENEKQGQLDLLCASVTDDAARRAAEGWQHTKMLYINRPGGHRRYWPMVFLERCAGIAAPYDPWYQKVQLSLALELPPPDLIVAEGGNLTQCSAISRMFGRKRCLAHYGKLIREENYAEMPYYLASHAEGIFLPNSNAGTTDDRP